MNPVSFGIAMPGVSTSRKPANPQFSGHYRVMVVDDDSTIRRNISKAFEFHGKKRGDTFSISPATNPEEAIEVFNAHPDEPFDFVSLDNSMPHPNQGMGLLDFIQKMGVNKPKHTSMYSSDDGMEAEALEHGADRAYNKKTITAPIMVRLLLDSVLGPVVKRPGSPSRSLTSPDSFQNMTS